MSAFHLRMKIFEKRSNTNSDGLPISFVTMNDDMRKINSDQLEP